MPSFTRSGRPDSSFARSSASEMTSTAPAVSSCIWRSTFMAPSAPSRSAFGERASAASAPCPRRATVTPASRGTPAHSRPATLRSDACRRIGSRSTAGLPRSRGGCRSGRASTGSATPRSTPSPRCCATDRCSGTTRPARRPGSTRSSRPCAMRSAAATRSRCRAERPRCASRWLRWASVRATRSSCPRSRSSRRSAPSSRWAPTWCSPRSTTRSRSIRPMSRRRSPNARPRSCPSTSRTSRATWTRSRSSRRGTTCPILEDAAQAIGVTYHDRARGHHRRTRRLLAAGDEEHHDRRGRHRPHRRRRPLRARGALPRPGRPVRHAVPRRARSRSRHALHGRQPAHDRDRRRDRARAVDAAAVVARVDACQSGRGSPPRSDPSTGCSRAASRTRSVRAVRASRGSRRTRRRPAGSSPRSGPRARRRPRCTRAGPCTTNPAVQTRKAADAERDRCPRTEDLVARTLTVGIGPAFTVEDCEAVAAAVHKVARHVLQ